MTDRKETLLSETNEEAIPSQYDGEFNKNKHEISIQNGPLPDNNNNKRKDSQTKSPTITLSPTPQPEQLSYVGIQQKSFTQKTPTSAQRKAANAVPSVAFLTTVQKQDKLKDLHKKEKLAQPSLELYQTKQNQSKLLKRPISLQFIPPIQKQKIQPRYQFPTQNRAPLQKKTPQKPVSKTVKRWFNLQMTGQQLTANLLAQEPKFRNKYKASIYTLNRSALIIQHWFFKKKQEAKNIKYVPFDKNKKLVFADTVQVSNKNSQQRLPSKTTPITTKPPMKPKKETKKDSMTESQSVLNTQQTFTQPNQIIIVQANNAAFDPEQLQTLVNNALQQVRGSIPSYSRQRQVVTQTNAADFNLFEKLSKSAPQTPKSLNLRALNYSVSPSIVLPEWQMLQKHYTPRPLKKYVPSVKIPKRKKSKRGQVSKDDFNLKPQPSKRKISSKKSKLSKSLRNSLSNKDAILEAVTASFKVMTDPSGKIVFELKEKSEVPETQQAAQQQQQQQQQQKPLKQQARSQRAKSTIVLPSDLSNGQSVLTGNQSSRNAQLRQNQDLFSSTEHRRMEGESALKTNLVFKTPPHSKRTDTVQPPNRVSIKKTNQQSLLEQSNPQQTLKDIEAKFAQVSKAFSQPNTKATSKLPPLPKLAVSKTPKQIKPLDQQVSKQQIEDNKFEKHTHENRSTRAVEQQGDEQEREKDLTRKMNKLKQEIQDIADEQKLLVKDQLNKQFAEYEINFNYSQIKDENYKQLNGLDESTINQILALKADLANNQIYKKIFCTLLIEKWVPGQLEKNEVLTKNFKQLLSKQNVKNQLESLMNEGISDAKLCYLEKVLNGKILTEKVSDAMGQLATLLRGILQQFRLKADSESLAKQQKTTTTVLERLQDEVKSRKEELYNIEKELFGEDVQFSMGPIDSLFQMNTTDTKEYPEFSQIIEEVEEEQRVSLLDDSSKMNINARFSATSKITEKMMQNKINLQEDRAVLPKGMSPITMHQTKNKVFKPLRTQSSPNLIKPSPQSLKPSYK